ncbi:unnamed protein product [Caenorhabditis angaria]|uniref:Uncharacterized protein n=1 Tax=Caenorhabditis angaria TaxID=860376 RepID=A0A9P1I964_9PELO|nr:unnamed protein product [Caenorhabditis angaria]
MSYNYNFMKIVEKNNQIMKTSVQYFIVTELLLNANVAYATYSEILDWEERTVRNLMYISSSIVMLVLTLCQIYFKGIRIVEGMLAFRALQIFAIFFITVTHEILLYPPTTILYFAIQFIYFFVSHFSKRMEFPGKIIRKVLMNSSKKANTSHFTSIANEVIRKSCKVDGEEDDDIFEYKTASEDELFSASSSFHH